MQTADVKLGGEVARYLPHAACGHAEFRSPGFFSVTVVKLAYNLGQVGHGTLQLGLMGLHQSVNKRAALNERQDAAQVWEAEPCLMVTVSLEEIALNKSSGKRAGD